MTFSAGRGLMVTLGAGALILTACSGPPPAEEPTGDAAEQAWNLVVGEHLLDQTVAYAYSLALNSREAPHPGGGPRGRARRPGGDAGGGG